MNAPTGTPAGETILTRLSGNDSLDNVSADALVAAINEVVIANVPKCTQQRADLNAIIRLYVEKMANFVTEARGPQDRVSVSGLEVQDAEVPHGGIDPEKVGERKQKINQDMHRIKTKLETVLNQYYTTPNVATTGLISELQETITALQSGNRESDAAIARHLARIRALEADVANKEEAAGAQAQEQREAEEAFIAAARSHEETQGQLRETLEAAARNHEETHRQLREKNAAHDASVAEVTKLKDLVRTMYRKLKQFEDGEARGDEEYRSSASAPDLRTRVLRLFGDDAKTFL